MISKHSFRLKKDGSPRTQCFCTHPELIENYDKAIADKTCIWKCHHKKEEFYTRPELIDLDMYYNVPPEDLVFVKDEKMHQEYPHKGQVVKYTEGVRRKLSEARKGKPSWNKGKHFSEEAKRKLSKSHTNKIAIQCVETGQVFESIKAAYKFVGLKDNAGIKGALKKPNYTAGGYHWVYANL